MRAKACDASVQERFGFIGREMPDVDIEQICQERSEMENPPGAFLLSVGSAANSLLAVRVEFLEDGQLLPCPPPPLAGATFDPDWGYARAEIELLQGQSAEFRLPQGRFETFRDGDTWGYRMCPIDNCEIPNVVRQLARIRAELAKPRHQAATETGIKVTITEL